MGMSATYGGTFSIDQESFDKLSGFMMAYGDGAADIVTEVLHDSGETIRNAIDPLIPVSGRTFKGHSTGARGSQWQAYGKAEPLAITVRSKSGYHYLYFPDDGTNTIRHAGNQQFMRRGAEAAAPVILDRAVDALIKDFERR